MMAAMAASTSASAIFPNTVAFAETIVGQGKAQTAGSLTIHRQNTDKQDIQGAEFSIYKIMDVTPGTNVGEWADSAFTAAFATFMADNGVTADALGNFSAAKTEGLVDKLAQFVNYGVVAPTAKATTDANGAATFSNLSLGWYLVVESNPVETSGQNVEFAVRPFIVSIPTTGVMGETNYGAPGSTYVDGVEGDYYNTTRDQADEFAGTEWIYDVTATPKATTLTIDKNITNAQAAKDADYTGSNNDYITTGDVYKDKRDTVGYSDVIEYTVETRVPEYSDSYFTATNDGTTTADVPVADANANGRAVFVITDKLSKGLTILQPQGSYATNTIKANAQDVILKRKINTKVTSDGNTSATDGTYTDELTKAYVKLYVEDGAGGWTELINPESTPSTDLSGKQSGDLFLVDVLTPEQQAADGHGANMTVRFTDHFLQSDLYRGKQIKVVYYAQVTQDAVMGTAGNTNDVVLTYSDTPHTNMWISPVEGPNADHTPVENPAEGTDIPAQVGDETPDAIVYTYGIQIDKFTDEIASGIGATKEALAGAKFKLYADVDLTKEVVGSAVKAGVDVAVKATADPDAIGYDAAAGPDAAAPAVFVTDDNGAIAIPTLDCGTYYLKEVQAPTGYSLLVNPIKIEIVPNEDADGKIIDGSWRMFIDGQEVTVDNGNNVSQIHQADGQAIVAVENHRGFTLPTTGGTGIILTVSVAVGGLLILNFCMLRKKKDKED